jgi:hypothetical protein
MSQYQLDLSSDPHSLGKVTLPQNSESQNEISSFQDNSENSTKKKFLGLKFTCCGVYSRVYVNRDGTAYEGRCPKCLKPVKLKIGESGTDSRFFEVF